MGLLKRLRALPVAWRLSSEMEQRSTGWAEWQALLRGVPSATGKIVSEESALNFGAVFAALRILGDGIGSLPLVVYRRRKGGGKDRAGDHPLYGILHDEPNPLMTPSTFKSTLTPHAAGWGNAYARIQFGADGRPVALWPRLPGVTTVERIAGPSVRYHTHDESGQAETLRPSEMLHIPGLGFDGLVGYSVLAKAREAIALGLTAEEFGARFFGNGANAGSVYQHPNKLSDDALRRLRESFAMRHAGITNAHAPMILEEGMTFEKNTIPPDDAQFLETRKFQVTEIARWFRVPPHMLGDLERATFTNIEHMSLEFVKYSLLPWLTRWEEEINRKLFPVAERQEYFAEFMLEELMRGDAASRGVFYHNAVLDGWMTRNEVRARENLNALDGLDEPLTPGNVIVGGEPVFAPKPPEPVEPEPEEPDDDEDDEDARALFAAEAARIATRYADRLARAEKKFGTPDDRHTWVIAFWDDESERSGDAVRRWMKLLGEDNPEAAMVAWFAARTEESLKNALPQ